MVDSYNRGSRPEGKGGSRIPPMSLLPDKSLERTEKGEFWIFICQQDSPVGYSEHQVLGRDVVTGACIQLYDATLGKYELVENVDNCLILHSIPPFIIYNTKKI